MQIVPLRTITTADLAESDSTSADSVVILTTGMDILGNIFGLEKWSKRGSDSVEIIQVMLDQMRRYKCSRGYIEKNRFESILRSTKKIAETGLYGDKEEVLSYLQKISLVPHYAVSKITRIKDNVVPYHRAHKLFIKNEWRDFMDFFIMFPAVEHDDIGDVLDMAVEYGRRPGGDVNVMFDTESLNQFNRSADIGQTNNNMILAKMPVNIFTGISRRKR